MLEQFTASARKAVQYASQAAFRYGHWPLDTLHLLHGTLRVEWGGARDLVTHLFGDVASLKRAVEEALEAIPGQDYVLMGQLPQSPAMKQAINNAPSEAAQLCTNYVGTEHELLALCAIPNDTVEYLLRGFGLGRNDVLDHIWAVDFDSLSSDLALALVRRARSWGGNSTEEAMQATLELAPRWSGLAGSRVDSAIRLMDEAESYAWSLSDNADEPVVLTEALLHRFIQERFTKGLIWPNSPFL